MCIMGYNVCIITLYFGRLSFPVRISAMKYQMGILCFARQQLVTLWYAIGLNTVMRLNTTLKQELQFA